MALFDGNVTARYVTQTRLNVLNSAWKALSVGSTPQANRFAVRIFIKGNPGQALALTYVNRNADKTFTAPTANPKNTTIYPGGRTWIEPLGDVVALYGRLVPKAANTSGSVEVIVTEYS